MKPFFAPKKLSKNASPTIKASIAFVMANAATALAMDQSDNKRESSDNTIVLVLASVVLLFAWVISEGLRSRSDYERMHGRRY